MIVLGGVCDDGTLRLYESGINAYRTTRRGWDRRRGNARFIAAVASEVGGSPCVMSIGDVGDAALAVRATLARNSVSSEDLWRFGALQLLDDYESVCSHVRADTAAMMFMEAPGCTVESGLDAAFAQLVNVDITPRSRPHVR